MKKPTPKKTTPKRAAAAQKVTAQETVTHGPLNPSSSEQASAAMEEAFKNAKTPEEMRELGRQFMANILRNMGRMEQQLSFFSRHSQALVADINDQFDYFNQCLGMLFTAVHLEMPQRMPRLLDAKVELVKTLKEGEECEMQAAYSKKKHPTFEHIQIVVGVDADAKTYGINGFNPIIGRRISEAFDALRTEKKLIDGHFYYVRLQLFHARPISENSVKVDITPAAANDDTVQTPS